MAKKSAIHHLPVGNGDMTLLKIASNNTFYTVLIDMHIRQNGNSDEDKYDALNGLHDLLETNQEGRPVVDVLVLTHPDEDHILGFEKHFHTGSPKTYKPSKDEGKSKIFVNEIWSSPIIFKRKSKNHNLCSDALVFQEEVKRRVTNYRDTGKIGEEGNRVRVIGKDSDGQTDDIVDIVYEIGDVIERLNEIDIPELQGLILAPLNDDDFPDNTSPEKNRSSIVMQWKIASHGSTTPTNRILLGGDASVDVWEILWQKHGGAGKNLRYDILVAPHHCSWHTLSHDSYSECDDPQVSDNAISALSQTNTGAVIVASSNTIKNDQSDPPNYQAMQEYKKIVSEADGEFICLSDYKPSKGKSPELLTYYLTNSGPQLEEAKDNKKSLGAVGIITTASSEKAIGHG